MMMSVLQTRTMVIVFGFFVADSSSTRCGEATWNGNVKPPFWLLQSPNYEKEYSRSVNCSWIIDWQKKEHALIVTVTSLKLFFENNQNERYCTGSYNFTINEEQVNCTRLVLEKSASASTKSFTKAFYNHATCSELPKVKASETVEQVTSPVKLEFKSDGRKHGTKYATSYITGFKIHYQLFDCTNGMIVSPITVAQTTSSTTLESITEVTTTTASKVLDTSIFSNFSSSSNPTSNTQRDSTKTNSSYRTTAFTTERTPQTNNPITAAAAGGVAGLLLFIIITATVIYCWKSSKSKQQPKKNGHEMKSLEENRAAETQHPVTIPDVYSTIDKATTVTTEAQPNNERDQSEPVLYEAVNDDQSKEVPPLSKSVSNAETSQPATAESTGPDVYAAVDKSKTGEKTTVRYEKETVENVLYGTSDATNVVSKSKQKLKDNGHEMKFLEENRASETQHPNAIPDAYFTIDKATTVTTEAQPNTEIDQSEPVLYEAVNEDQSKEVTALSKSVSKAETSQPNAAESTEPDVYAAVDKSTTGEKSTVHYEKETVDNLLYGTSGVPNVV